MSIPISGDIESLDTSSKKFAPEYVRWSGFYVFDVDKSGGFIDFHVIPTPILVDVDTIVSIVLLSIGGLVILIFVCICIKIKCGPDEPAALPVDIESIDPVRPPVAAE